MPTKKATKTTTPRTLPTPARKAPSKTAPKKSNAGSSSATDTDTYMANLVHPLKKVAIAVRDIIKNADPSINERVKWAAPSYYTTTDLVTFNFRTQKHIHLVFHHAAIAAIKSHILHGDYKDRRMMYFESLEEVNQHKTELQRIMKVYVKTAK